MYDILKTTSMEIDYQADSYFPSKHYCHNIYTYMDSYLLKNFSRECYKRQIHLFLLIFPKCCHLLTLQRFHQHTF